MKHKKRNIPQKTTMSLKDNHTWKAPKGYKIVVLDRGVVSFNIPQSWVVANMEPFELNDREPPDDDARISVSHWRFPPGIDWSALPLGDLLKQSITGTSLTILERGEVIEVTRPDLQFAWTEHRFDDPVEHREAYSRFVIARSESVHALITCDYWVTDADRIRPIWHEVLRSLQLGRVIADPTRGVVLHRGDSPHPSASKKPSPQPL